MNRRDVLKGFVANSVALTVACPRHLIAQLSGASDWRVFEVTTSVEVLEPSGRTLVWVPKPLLLSTPFQRTIATSIDCSDGRAKTHHTGAEEPGVIAVEFPSGARPVLKYRFRVATRDRHVDLVAPGKPQHVSQDELKTFLRPTKNIPIDGIVREKSRQITKGATTDIDKARAIYQWIIENTYRNPKVRGCGKGDIRFMLESGDLGGKCADLNGLYVGLARAAGLPSRDVYGIRVAKSREGYKSLGTSTEVITKAQHCRAEVYLNAFGWVPVDPADVRKVVLEEAEAPLPIDDEKVKVARSRLFGSWEMNWIGYNFAPDVALPGSELGPIAFFMYPQGETSRGRLDCLDPENFSYDISSREISAIPTPS
jgi:transglutaminase-like putative cysteine protease